MFHVTGCNSQLLLWAYLAGTSVIMPQFEVGAFLRAIETERIDVLTSVPAIYWLAINQPQFAETDVSSVRGLLYGGAPIAPELVGRIMKAFPNARSTNGFGLTETASAVSNMPHEYAAAHTDAVGFPLPVIDVRVDTSGAQDVGELLVRGPNVVAGYWNNPEGTARAFIDGWLHTGDLARIDAEGLVYVVDRVKDMINRGGENVYCVEVENALAGAPGVYEAAVVGVPDEVMGEKVGAVLVPAPGATIDADAVLAYLGERIARLQDAAVRRRPARSAAPQPRREAGQTADTRRNQLGLTGALAAAWALLAVRLGLGAWRCRDGGLARARHDRPGGSGRGGHWRWPGHRAGRGPVPVCRDWRRPRRAHHRRRRSPRRDRRSCLRRHEPP